MKIGDPGRGGQSFRLLDRGLGGLVWGKSGWEEGFGVLFYRMGSRRRNPNLCLCCDEYCLCASSMMMTYLGGYCLIRVEGGGWGYKLDSRR